MINLPITDEQLITLVTQLPKDKKKEIMDQLKFDEWLETPEAIKLKEGREKEIREGRIMTMDQMKEKLRLHGKDI